MARDQQSLDYVGSNHLGGENLHFVPDIVLGIRRFLPKYFYEITSKSGLGIAPVDCTFALGMSNQEKEIFVSTLADAASNYHSRTGEPIRIFVQVSLPGHDDDAPVAKAVAKLLHTRGYPTKL
ncbi:MAG: hypothetical protein HC904_17045 [Blastochloris sp.]|nr:hypothetical protein [Blastochloris sp.]